MTLQQTVRPRLPSHSSRAPSTGAAHRIRRDAEALDVARRLAEDFAAGSSDRDRDRRLPFAELDRFSLSGLWGITVPKSYGGADVSAATLAEVTAIISAADASLGQIPQNHFYMVEAIRLDGSDSQKRFYFDRILEGDRIGNAFCELGSRVALEFETRLLPAGENWVVDGRKFYSTGVLFAHWIAVVAKNPADQVVIAFLPRDAAGVTILDDWDSFGQRTTGSGSTILERTPVDTSAVIPHHSAFDRPTAMGPIAQIIHAAVDLGIARAAVADTIQFVRDHARPWADSGLDRAADDPYSIAAVGELQIKLHGAEALAERAGALVDAARESPSERSVADASVAVAEAKVLSTEVALLASNRLFELGGTRSTLAKFNLDRHWRNARTHTLHDPVRWKYHAVGNFWVNGINPPRHGAS
ncbi:MAG: SfnB family sulfur acquisition oxidoreductase [Rhodospirillales bacterium]|nr:SfnB family sulfur acquisition oxidoreductase [Rhodospirillales bacterium]